MGRHAGKQQADGQAREGGYAGTRQAEEDGRRQADSKGEDGEVAARMDGGL